MVSSRMALYYARYSFPLLFHNSSEYMDFLEIHATISGNNPCKQLGLCIIKSNGELVELLYYCPPCWQYIDGLTSLL